MTRPAPLPAVLRDRAFLTTDATALAVPHWRLRRADLVSGGQGIWCPADRPLTFDENVRIQQRAMPDAVISHVTAARLFGLWLPPRLQRCNEIHLTRPHNYQQTRRPNVHGHSSRLDPGQICVLDGVRLVVPGRAWIDLAPRLTDDELIIIGDQLVRLPWTPHGRGSPMHTPGALDDLIETNACRPGVRRIRLARPLLRVGSDSPPETRLRLSLVRADLPEPELQLLLNPADPCSPAADLGYRRWRIAIQYEGAHHLSVEQQALDISRDDRWLRAGWTYFRVGPLDLRQGFRPLLARLRELIPYAEMKAPVAGRRA